MASQTTGRYSQLVSYPNAKYIFYFLSLSIFIIGFANLYIFDGMTELYLGLPLWIWLQNVTFAIMIILAWIAVRLRAIARKGGV